MEDAVHDDHPSALSFERDRDVARAFSGWLAQLNHLVAMAPRRVVGVRGPAQDVDALRAMVQRQIAAGIHGLVPCGTTGEAAAGNGRAFLLIDNNPEAVGVMCRRLERFGPEVPKAGCEFKDS